MKFQRKVFWSPSKTLSGIFMWYFKLRTIKMKPLLCWDNHYWSSGVRNWDQTNTVEDFQSERIFSGFIMKKPWSRWSQTCVLHWKLNIIGYKSFAGGIGFECMKESSREVSFGTMLQGGPTIYPSFPFFLHSLTLMPFSSVPLSHINCLTSICWLIS